MIRIKDFTSKVTLKAAVVLSALLLFAAAAAFGQQQINLTVAPTTATMPDGTIVPMWGYFCGTSVAGSTATCSSLNPNSLGAPPAWKASTAYTQGALIVDSNGNVQVATIGGTSGAAAPTWNTSGTTTDGGATGVTWTFQSSLATYLATAGSWSPIVITVPAGTSAAPAGLTINLTNDLSFAAGANNIPTSIVIVGQVGGGLGSAPTTTAPPDHSSAQGCVSWFIANNLPGTPCTSANNQGMATPPAQGPRIQSMGAEVAAGGTTPTALTWSALKPGTYLLESGTHPSIQVPMGLIGVLVVTNAPTGNGTATPAAGTAYPATANSVAVPYNAELPLEFSEIDPVQNKAVAAAVNTAGFTETAVWTAMNSLGAITSFHVTNPGSGYTSVPSVTIAPPVASGATATATATATAVMGLGNVAVTAGSGYNLGTTTVSLSGGGGTGATIASAWSLNNVAIAAGGSGYAVNDTFTVTGVGPSMATITVQTVDSSTTGVITGVTFTATGNFQLGPTTVTYNGQAGGKTGTGATLTPTFSLVSIAVTSGGTGYTSSPSVSITDTSVLAGTGATAVATLDVVAINVTNAGDGYGAAQIAAQTTAPIVTIGSAPTGGTTATATAAAAAARRTPAIPRR